jgi:hypothetical protein
MLPTVQGVKLCLVGLDTAYIACMRCASDYKSHMRFLICATETPREWWDGHFNEGAHSYIMEMTLLHHGMCEGDKMT